MLAIATFKQWPLIFAEYHRILRKGGYLEILECDMETKRMGPATTEINTKFRESLRKRDIDVEIAINCSDIALAAGFSEPDHSFVSVPLGQWGGYVGRLMEEDVLMALPRLLGKKVENDTNEVIKDEFSEYRSYLDFHTTVIRKV
ncbi:hypothetical protein BC937DRAFT_92054 [Endogone sp. FLAS-F59071]|nr:hypothetical protein BC937DRAFT_92054 [Endogone sp. FLAS-F59071]|eukprot:RUS15741.1 hypothetical protein BC937DRAFT_92054 [Endogone sp. FLAS-F59071]